MLLAGRDTPVYTEITVEDQGGGFPPEELPRIFERFYRGKEENSKNCGIGLSLSRSILAAQNGTISAENYGKGAKFTIKLYKQSL
ncbi:MAG: sensor histidine kinase [Oscillospiraceae bacterium]|nr:sensor histidine kinase [Oscillospiraceae bacterium]